MICFACAPSSAGTAIRSSLSASGKAVRERTVAITASMPWVSSSPRTTSASICGGVRKTTTRSGRCAGMAWSRQCAGAASYRQPPGRGKRPIDLEQDHRHVVMLIGAADERFDLAQDALAKLTRVEVTVFFDDPAQARLAEQIALDVHRLRDPIGVEDDDVAGAEIDALLFEQLLELFLRSVDAQAQDH